MSESIPAVVAHGGAGPGPDRQKNVEEAVKVASKLLAREQERHVFIPLISWSLSLAVKRNHF